MTTSRDPLEGIERVLIDGTNLLHAIRRGPEPAPAATLIGRLRAVIPSQVRIELVFDGPPDPGSGNMRIASGLTVRYSGRLSADALLTRLVAEAAPFTIEPVARILVVTDDNDLGRAVRRHGATTARTAWLRHRLERTTLAAPSIGRRRAPAAGPAGETARDEEAAAPRWQPGRGATKKRGNPRRGSRSARPSGD